MANRHLEAFKEGFNLAGLATAASATFALIATPFMPIPLLAAIVAEVAYLMFVPDSRWYDERVSKRDDQAVIARRQNLKAQTFPILAPSMRARFEHLEGLRARLDGLVATRGAERKWHREILRKLDYLLEKFLQFAAKEAGFRNYLQGVLDECNASVSGPTPPAARTTQLAPGTINAAPKRLGHVPPPPAPTGVTSGHGGQLASALPPVVAGARRPNANTGHLSGEEWAREAVKRISEVYERDIERLRVQTAGEPDTSTRDVMQKRVEILERRREFAVKLGRILANIHHQLQLSEDTFGLITDEMMARPPEQVLSSIEDVVSQANTMSQVLDEIAPIENMMSRFA